MMRMSAGILLKKPVAARKPVEDPAAVSFHLLTT